MIPTVAQEDIDIGGIFLTQYTVGQMLHQADHRGFDANMVAAEAHGLGGGDLQKARLIGHQRAQWIARCVRVRRHRQHRWIGHAGNKMVYAEQPGEALGGQVIGKGAVYPF